MIYEHATLITVDPQRRIIADGALAVDNGQFVSVDKSQALRDWFPDEPRTNLLGRVVTLCLEDQIGSLEVGKQTDFVVFALDRSGLIPHIDPASTLVCAATGRDVNTVVIRGRLVAENGQVLIMDEEFILREAGESDGRLRTRWHRDPTAVAGHLGLWRRCDPTSCAVR